MGKKKGKGKEAGASGDGGGPSGPAKSQPAPPQDQGKQEQPKQQQQQSQGQQHPAQAGGRGRGRGQQQQQFRDRGRPQPLQSQSRGVQQPHAREQQAAGRQQPQHSQQYYQQQQPGMQQYPGMQQHPPGMQQYPGMQQPPPGMQQYPGMQQPPPGMQQYPGMQQPPPGMQQYPGMQQPLPGMQQQHPGRWHQHQGRQQWHVPQQEPARGRQPAAEQQMRQAASPPVQPSPQPSPQQGAVKKGQPQPQGQPQQAKGSKQQQQERSVETPRAGGDTGVAQAATGIEKMTVQGGGDVPQLAPKLTTVRRTGGTMCRKRITVVTNHFPLSLGSLTKAYHYDVDIVPDRPKKLYRDIMEQFRRKMFKDRYPAFDGAKNLYSAKPLCDGSMSETVTVIEDEDRKREFKVTIKQVAYVDLSSLHKFFEKMRADDLDKPMQAMQCIDVVLRSAPLLSFIPVGRSFFQARGGQKYHMGDGTELYNGFYQSAIVGWKPFLNMDVTHKVFAKAQPVVEFINELAQGKADPSKPLFDDHRKTLSKHIKNLKVEYKLPNNPASRRVYRVNDIGEPACAAKFEVTDEKTKATKSYTVVEYYAKEKRQNLKYPRWPTLWVGNKNRTILIPLEFCTVLGGQAVNRGISDNERRNMIRHTATTAPDRLNKITNFMKNVEFKKCPQLDEFGIKVTEQPQVVEARVLEPPSLQYQERKLASVSRGVWRANRFFAGATINRWTIVCLDDRTQPPKLDQLEQELINSGRKSGVNMGAAERQGRDFTKIRLPFNEKQILQQLVDLFNSLKDMDLIVVVIPERKFVYHYVKQASELRAGKLTQCVKGNTVFRVNSMTADNLMLKINAKLNGTNHTLSPQNKPRCFSRPFVIMGADVTHPGPEAQNIPSVAAVTCSYDANGFKYIFDWRLQSPKVEIIQDLEQITKKQLMHFYKLHKGAKPESIFFFRDGVSDGQFQQVLSSELTAIRKACTSLGAEYKPKITFLVVQKRHHTRFFPTNPRDSEDRGGNVPAGTCVDTEITHPCAIDFYLVSHASIQGVARPTKYRILWDDSNMTEDEIESLTYYLCHLFARCNRSVSYPTPTYYAHLAAARAKVYCETDQAINMSKLDDFQKRLMVNADIMQNLPMYFV